MNLKICFPLSFLCLSPVFFVTETPSAPLAKYFVIDNIRSHDARKELLAMAEFCENAWECRRKLLMDYFNENEKSTCADLYTCDNCTNLKLSLKQDGTAAAKLVVSEIKSMDLNEKLTLPLLIEILKGSRQMRVIEGSFDKSKLHGFLRQWSKAAIRKLLNMLIVKKFLD